MQMFAVEVLDNAANLAAIFYTSNATPRYAHPRPRSGRTEGNTPRPLTGPPYYRSGCRPLNGSFGGAFGGSFGGTGSASSSGYRIRR